MPSIGSTTQLMPLLPDCRAPSSPSSPSAGRTWRRWPRMSASAAVSITVTTSVSEDLVAALVSSARALLDDVAVRQGSRPRPRSPPGAPAVCRACQSCPHSAARWVRRFGQHPAAQTAGRLAEGCTRPPASAARSSSRSTSPAANSVGPPDGGDSHACAGPPHPQSRPPRCPGRRRPPCGRRRTDRCDEDPAYARRGQPRSRSLTSGSSQACPGGPDREQNTSSAPGPAREGLYGRHDVVDDGQVLLAVAVTVAAPGAGELVHRLGHRVGHEQDGEPLVRYVERRAGPR